MFDKKRPHFLLVGHDGAHNRGCEALIRSTVMVLRDQFPHASFTLATMYPELEGPLTDIKDISVVPGYNRNFNISDCIPIPKLKSNRLMHYLRFAIQSLYKNQLAHEPIRPLHLRTEQDFHLIRHLKKSLFEADALISTGGDLYNDDYGPPAYLMEIVEYAQFLRRTTIIWGASIWPYKTKWTENRMREMLIRTDLITVRDDETANYLASLGIYNNVARVADGAFLMPPSFTDKTALPWAVRPSTVIGFNGSDLLFSYLSQSRAKQTLSDLVAFFQSLIDNEKYGVILMPHDGYPGAAERDFLFGFEQLIDRPEKVYMIPVGLNAPEIKAVISQCDFFISMRFHPSIASLGQCIPTLGISHSPKFSGLYKSVFGHTEYLIPYDEITYDALKKKFTKLQSDKEEIREHLGRRIPELQAQARLGGKCVKDLLNSKLKTAAKS